MTRARFASILDGVAPITRAALLTGATLLAGAMFFPGAALLAKPAVSANTLEAEALGAVALAETRALWKAERHVPQGTISSDPVRPRLVVLIAVDQLRGDYLQTFRPYFGEGGFRRFVEQGAVFTQAMFDHGTTKTCPGHAVVSTGAQPADHGIVANNWWNSASRRVEYCAYDPGSPLVGGEGEGRSPRNLAAPTFGDVLRLSNGGQSRVVAVAGKDRSAIMLGGRLANAAYWPVGTSFVTSRYYADALPDWVRRFNDSGTFERYLGKAWEKVLPEEAYALQGRDDQPGEAGGDAVGRSFPHLIGDREAGPGRRYVRALERSPFHDELVVELALEALRNEGLGRGDQPDILIVGLSATDRIGHAWGPNSHEIMDAIVRLDRLLARLFDALDAEIGLENAVVALTADHGVAPLPELIRELRPGDGAMRLHPDTVIAAAEAALDSAYGAHGGEGWVVELDAPNLYLDEDALLARGVDLAEAERIARDAVRRVDGVHEARTRSELLRLRDEGVPSPLALSIHPERSGHVVVVPRPFVLIDDDPDGTGHGTPWGYDRHVPVAFVGAGIRPGEHHVPAAVVDIAPTLAALLGIQRPPAATGRVLVEALDPAVATPVAAHSDLPARPAP